MSEIFHISNFKRSTANKLIKSQNFHVSKEKYVAQLKTEKYGFSKDSWWIIKELQFTWVAHEYISSKLYQFILGKDDISDIRIIKDDQSPLPKLAISFHDNFEPFNINTGQAGIVPFECVFGGCTISNENIVKFSKNFSSSYNSLPINGAAKAWLTSRLLSEGDDQNHIQYATKLTPNSLKIIRYDFDDSLKFFDQFKITPGMTEDSLNPQVISMLKQIGKTVDYINQNTMSTYLELNWQSFIANKDAHPITQYNPKQFLDALKEIVAVDRSKVGQLIDESFADLASLWGNQFKKNYNIEALKKSLKGEFNSDTSVANNAAALTKKMINSHLDQMDKITKCLAIEIDLKENNAKALAEDLSKDSSALLCTSFFESGKNLVQNVLTHHIKAEFYNICQFPAKYYSGDEYADAAKVLGEYCQDNPNTYHNEL